MKKLFIVALIGILLTGCSSGKTLTCTQEQPSQQEDMENSGVQVKISFNKDGTEIKKLSQITYINYKSSISDEDFNTSYNSAATTCDQYKNYSGLKCSVKKDGKKISLIMDIDLKEANDETKQKMSLTNITEANYDSMKEEAQTAGYTCK